MVFSSLFFIFVFLPMVMGVYFISPQKIRNLILLIASLIFYGWGEPKYIVLMILSILINYVIVLKMDQSEHRKKWWLWMAIFIDLLILGFFKYYGFLLDNINHLFSVRLKYTTLPLPIGISFYTFQILSYVVDVYLEKIKPQKNLISFSLYVTMFPQLVAGPIVKYADIEKQLKQRSACLSHVGMGAKQFIRGLGKKVLLANNIGLLWTTVEGIAISDLSVVSAWLGILAFTFQIYFDFSGYSDMAIGLGKMFGFEMKENFNYPYASRSITEFWRRWHISLGSWFREYVYIPLGGNKRGVIKQVRNLFVVWLLTGLWHGASWNFVIWGLYYGLILWIEKVFLKQWLLKIPSVFRRVYTLGIVMIGWTLFSIEDLGQMTAYLRVMFGFSSNSVVDLTARYLLSGYSLLLIVLLLGSTPLIHQIYLKLTGAFKERLSVFGLMLQLSILLLCTAYLVTTTYNPFLYFRF